jgi:hypothetical protein
MMGREKEAVICFKEVASMAAKIKNQDVAEDAVLFYEKMYARWNPSYIKVLPGVILGKIFCELEMQDVISCLQVCKASRATILKTLNWKPTVTTSLTLPLVDVSQNRINTLPSETLILIFSYSDTQTVLACQDVCKRWRRIVSKEAHKWLDEIEIKGSLRKMNKQWIKILRLARGRKIESLSIYHTRDRHPYVSKGEDELSWTETAFSATFPHKTLRKFSYDSYGSNDLDQDIWNTILRCTQLKVLTFNLVDSFDDCDFKMSNKSNLAKCRLDTFDLSISCDNDFGPLDLENGMYNLLSEVRSLFIGFSCSPQDLEQILASAKETLEELHIYWQPEEVQRYQQEDMNEVEEEDDKKAKGEI